ncbi:putative ribonuclease H-like domain-containing protein [Tanacetum coccineum]
MLADSLLHILFWAEAVNTACYVLNRVLVTKPQNKTPYELLIGKSPSISLMRPFGCPLTILNTLDSLGKFDGKSDKGYLLGYSTSSKAFKVYNKRTKRVEENLHINFLEDQPNVAGTSPNWMFDLDFLTNSMNYIPVSVENQVIVDAGTQDSYVVGSLGNHKGPTQEYILLPLQPHRTRIPVKDVVQDAQEQPSENASPDKGIQVSEDVFDKEGQHQMPEDEQVWQDELEMMVTQEVVANAMNDESRQAFEEEKRRIASQKKAAQASSANADESSFVYLGGKIPIDASTLPNADLPIDPNMPELEDASDTFLNDGIFNGAYDDDEDVGAVADFNNMDNTITVSPIPILRIHKDHPKGQILGDPTSAVQTRGKIQKASSAQQALVWILVDLPFGKKAIGTKWVFRNKRDERSIVVNNKARLVAQGHGQEEGIDYDEVFALTSDDEEEVSGVQKVRHENQTVKTRDDKSGQNSHKQGVSFRKVKACFVCISTEHLIKDYNFHDKKSQESNLKNVVNTGKWESKPEWDNTKRVDHPNFSKYPHLSVTFVLAGVSSRTGLHRPSINTARSVCTVRPSISTARPVCTARPNINTVRPVSTARPSISTARPSINTARPVNTARPTFRPKDLKQDVKTFGVKNMTTAGKRAVVSKGKVENVLKKTKWGNPEILLQDHAVVDSCCSSHMTGNKAYQMLQTFLPKDLMLPVHMANLKYSEKHNMVAFLKKPNESVGFTEVVDFLKVRTLANGTQQLVASIDSKEYNITEASVRSKLQLRDATGIHNLSDAEIYAGLATLGPKSGGWDQFGSTIATALICLSSNRVYNFSKMIFDRMVHNLESNSKILMYPRFSQIILDITTENKGRYLAPTLTKKLFANMKRGYTGDIIPLLPAMLVEIAVDQGEGSSQPAEPQHILVDPISTTSLPPIPSPLQQSPNHPSPLHQSLPYSPPHLSPRSLHPSPPFSPPHYSSPRSYEAPLPKGNTSRSAEDSMQLKELMNVKSLEKALKRKSNKVLISESEGEESQDQGRKIQDIDDDPLVSLVRESMKEKSTDFVTPTKALGEAQEEEISPTILEAAKTLSKVAFQGVSKEKSTDKGKRYRRRARSMAKKIDTGLDARKEVNTGREKINTGIEEVSTGSTKVDSGTASKRGQREGKAPMVEEDIQATHKTKEQMRQEEAGLEEAIKLQAQLDEEVAKQIHLDKMIAKRMAEEEALTEQQKKRKAQVQFEAQFYTEEDWDAIRAKLEANAELTKDVLGKDLPEQDFAKRMVDMVNQRKKHFAEERAKAKRNKPMTQSQLRIYMSNYLKNQGTWKLSQLKKLKFEEIKEEFDKLVQQIDTFVPINLEATKAKLKRYGEELQTKTSKKQRTGKRKKQKARKGINVDKSAQEDSETDKEESVEAMNPTPLTTKSDSVVNWKIFQQGQRSIYQIMRANRANTVYMSFGAMIKDFTIEDLIELYRLVMQKYGTNRPEDAYDRVLWSDLRTMFDPPLNEDAIWSLPLQKKMVSWRYYDKCEVHCLTLEACTIYMLADRKYPLSKEACQVMLKMKLLDGKMNEVCYKILKMIEKQAEIRK